MAGGLGAMVALMVYPLQAQETWRSALYPGDWTPAFTDSKGRFLHDFSYAGYRNGEAPVPEVKGPVLNTVDFGADPTGKRDSTAAIQSAIDGASRDGGVVLLPKGLFRCDSGLTVKASSVVIRGEGAEATRLFFASVPKRGWSNHLQVSGAARQGPKLPLAADGANRSFRVDVEDAGDLEPGDDIAIGWTITPEFIEEHHMTGTWKSFNGKWRPFFLRTVREVDRSRTPNRIHLDVPLRYPAKVRDEAAVVGLEGYVSECSIESLGIANAVEWNDAWSRAGIHAIGLTNTKDCWVRDVVSFPSPHPDAKGYHLQGGGVYVGMSKRVTIADCRMEKAQNRGGGGAGYLFEITRSNEILTRDCTAVAGRHNFIQNWDFGASGLVWLRCLSRDGRGYGGPLDKRGYEGLCEYHHSLATACLVDSCTLDDGWFGGNRHNWSSGAGSTVTQSVYWNTSGKGVLRSWQSGDGYVIGTQDISVETSLDSRFGEGTAPEDFVEGEGKAAALTPSSLYEDQLRIRLPDRQPE